MNEKIIPQQAISEGLGEVFYLLPLPFIIMVIGVSLWLGIIRLNGSSVKLYKLYNTIVAVSLAVIAHFTIPVDEVKVNDIPTLIVAIISSGVFIEIFIYWRKKKNKS